MPDEPEALGLLALMLLHDARQPARVDPAAGLVPLEEQDRSAVGPRHDRGGDGGAGRGAAAGRPGPYQVQAAIAALHAQAREPRRHGLAADRRAVPGARRRALAGGGAERAVAVAMADGPDVGLALTEDLADELDGYHLFHAARADLFRRLGRGDEAAAAYRRALELTTNPEERAFLERRLREV